MPQPMLCAKVDLDTVVTYSDCVDDHLDHADRASKKDPASTISRRLTRFTLEVTVGV